MKARLSAMALVISRLGLLLAAPLPMARGEDARFQLPATDEGVPGAGTPCNWACMNGGLGAVACGRGC